MALHFIIMELSLVNISILEGPLSSWTFHALFKHAFIDVALAVSLDSVAIFLVEKEATFIAVLDYTLASDLVHLSFTLGHSLYELAFNRHSSC